MPPGLNLYIMKTKNSERPITADSKAFRDHYKVIAPLIMGSGVGDGKTTACVMAQAATIDALRKGKTLDRATDEMECACPVLRRLAIRLNDTDWWKDNAERTEVLRPLIPLLLDSRGTGALTMKRIFMSADHSVRVLTLMRLEWISKHSKSAEVKKANKAGIKKLKELPEIVDKASALSAREICSELQKYADAYAYASASAYADASAYASEIKSQKLKYRTALLELFCKLAALSGAQTNKQKE